MERARHKQRILEAHGLRNPGFEDDEVTVDVLLEWYFERLSNSGENPVEAYTAIEEFARDDLNAFLRAVLREFCYQCRKNIEVTVD
jgi:hypothetical protein